MTATNNENPRKILVTAALPYANGDIHIGHLVEYLQADIWVRFQKLRGHECLYICATDTHGTPIMVEARKQKISPESLIESYHQRHYKDLKDYQIEFDHFGTTNDAENKELTEAFFHQMEDQGHITTRSIEQAYCNNDQMFLPDRFVKGTCPKCDAENQYGDSCDVCASTYSPLEMKAPQCSLCGETPTEKTTEHVFYRLNDFRAFLQTWTKEHTPREIYNKLKEWLDEDLRDWDISRDMPYFGFEIPGHKNKYFYVWMDAPIGYIASTKKWAQANGRNYEEFWKNPDSEIYHFIGKDIFYFHSLFWPAMLKNVGYQTPEQIFVHGMLSVNGKKMSKSKGTCINASTFLKQLDPMYIRYYYATKLTSSIDDFDLSFEDFIQRINSELVGKITNLASRGAQMLKKKMDGRLGLLPEEGRILVQKAADRQNSIAQHFENRDYAKALIEVREIADEANKYFDEKEPWKLIKTDPEATRGILTSILNSFRIISIYLKPVLPEYVAKVELLLKIKALQWSDLTTRLENQEIGDFVHLAQRVTEKDLETVVSSQLGQQSSQSKS